MQNNLFLSLFQIVKKYQTWRQTITALNGVSFDIYKQEIISLLGINGAGKTTLSSILATLHPPTDGTIRYNGTSIYDDIYTYRKLIGYCPQNPNLHPLLTIKQNLVFAGLFYGMHESDAQERAQLLIEQYNLERYADEFIMSLSGGYKQRVSIARTLMHNPEFIIFDEPTVGLDPHIRHKLWDYIKELKNNGKTILLTTHYLDEAEQLSDRICILNKGVVKLIEKTEHLKQAYQQQTLEKIFIQLIEEKE
jgi:ABC-2 type transport system ATP-binding protein